MAEIKSTLEMVLARADKMCSTAETPDDQSSLHKGMKTAVSYMNQEPIDLAQQLNTENEANKSQFSQGILSTFLRNISLPRDEENTTWERAIEGLAELAKIAAMQTASEINSYLSEINKILTNYNQHKIQIRTQLEENFAVQSAQLEQNLAQQTGQQIKINPNQHPKFNEEWSQALGQLNDQYLNALDQYKNAITQLFN